MSQVMIASLLRAAMKVVSVRVCSFDVDSWGVESKTVNVDLRALYAM